MIFDSIEGVFVKESVGWGVDVIVDAQGGCDALTKLGFTCSQISLESEDEGVFFGEVKVFIG